MDIKHEYEISTFTCVTLPKKNKIIMFMKIFWSYIE